MCRGFDTYMENHSESLPTGLECSAGTGLRWKPLDSYDQGEAITLPVISEFRPKPAAALLSSWPGLQRRCWNES
jgi:hypothetical protein